MSLNSIYKSHEIIFQYYNLGNIEFMSKTIKNLISLSLIVITLYTVFRYSGSTTVWWISLGIILIIFMLGKIQFYDSNNHKNIYVVQLFLIWNIIGIVRGFFVANGYWEWKALIETSIVMLLPLCCFVLTNTFLVQKVVQQWFRYLLPAFFALFFLITAEHVGHYLMPVSFLLLFFPFLTTKWKMICIGMAMVVFAANLGARSNVIKFLVPIVLSIMYYFKFPFTLKVFKTARAGLMILPILLLYLAITNVFNVFKMSEYLDGDFKYGRSDIEGSQDDLTADTRTFLYVEVIASALKYDYVWFGRTPARGYESPWFGPSIDKDLGTDKMERHGNEVNILNIFTWTGIIGVVLYFFIFLKATYLALYRSKSRIMKILGVYMAFRWAYGWVEDFTSFNLSYFFLWITISMCLSQDFRAMTDPEFKNWVRGILDYRYRSAIIKKTRVSLHKM